MARGPLWILGIFLEILSTLSGTAGKQLIRFSELTNKKAPALSKTFFYVGLLINTIAGPILDMAAYSFAAQSLIAPFGGLDVVWNAALAPYFLKESLTRARLVACAMIFSGTLLSSLFANHHEEDYTIEMLEEKLVDARVLIYLGCLALFVLFNILGPMRKEKGDLLRGVSLGVTAGVIAGNMFCVKAAVELIETSMWDQKGEIWLHWMPYAVLAGAAFFALSNVVFMTKGLLEYEALFMVTIYEGSMIVSNCISASIVLLELEGLEWWRCVLWTLCVVTVCIGMFIISNDEQKVRKDKCDNPLGAEAATVVGGQEVDAADEEEPLPASAVMPLPPNDDPLPPGLPASGKASLPTIADSSSSESQLKDRSDLPTPLAGEKAQALDYQTKKLLGEEELTKPDSVSDSTAATATERCSL